MASKSNDMVVEARAINYARIASPVLMYKKTGNDPKDMEWKADLLIDEDTVDAIEKKYPNLRKRINPITPKKYNTQYKVEMPNDVEGPHILKLTMPVEIEFKDKQSGELKRLEKPQPRVLVSEGGKAKEVTFDELIGNGSYGQVILKHRSTAYEGSPIDVVELGSINLKHLVEVNVKPGGTQEDDLSAAFGLEEIEESNTKAPERNEAPLERTKEEEADLDDEVPDFELGDLDY